MPSVPLSSRAPSRDIEISSRKDSKFEIGNEKIPLLAGTDEPVSTDDPKATQKVFVDGKAAAYVCENFTCQAPVTDPVKLRELLAH